MAFLPSGHGIFTKWSWHFYQVVMAFLPSGHGIFTKWSWHFYQVVESLHYDEFYTQLHTLPANSERIKIHICSFLYAYVKNSSRKSVNEVDKVIIKINIKDDIMETDEVHNFIQDLEV